MAEGFVVYACSDDNYGALMINSDVEEEKTMGLATRVALTLVAAARSSEGGGAGGRGWGGRRQQKIPKTSETAERRPKKLLLQTAKWPTKTVKML